MKPNLSNVPRIHNKDILFMLNATLAAARACREAEKQGNESLRVAYQEQMDLRADYTRTLIRRYWEANHNDGSRCPAECCNFAALPCPVLRQLAYSLLESVSELHH